MGLDSIWVGYMCNLVLFLRGYVWKVRLNFGQGFFGMKLVLTFWGGFGIKSICNIF